MQNTCMSRGTWSEELVQVGVELELAYSVLR